MKRLLPLLLALLLLAGCATGNEETTAPIADTTLPAPVGLYDPENPVEAATGGAVRAYPLQADNFIGLSAMGSRLLLIADDGSLTALKGEDCQISATLLTGRQIFSSSVGFDTAAQGAAYYMENSREVVLLNPQLQQSASWVLPEDIVGEPAVSLSTDEVYYSIPGELRALNLQTGISRLVRSHPGTTLTITGCHFDGTVLECMDSDAGRLFLSAQTGERLSSGRSLLSLYTAGKTYFSEFLDGSVLSKIFGTLNTTAQALNVEGTPAAALELNGVVIYQTDKDGLQLDFYDLISGQRRSSVQLPGVTDPVAFLATDSHLWVLSYADGHQVLYRWDTGESLTDDETVHTGPLYTASAPDVAGLDACQARVVEMNQKYGVRLHIWQDAVKNPGTLTLTPEHQVITINAMLDALEPMLALFPSRFLQTTVESGWIHICLVRNTGNNKSFAQYWHNGDCYIAISSDAAQSFLQGVGFAIDTHVLGNSRDFDDWSLLNPEGFSYTNGAEPADKDWQYLDGDDRAFVDAHAMEYPHTDRSRLFAAAMSEGNAEIFAAPIMQAKLKLLCQGIREAYGLEKSAESYLWEQYLEESLAYTR